MSTVDGRRLHTVMGVETWAEPVPFGPDGWAMHARENYALVLATACAYDENSAGDVDVNPDANPDVNPATVWIHASLTRSGVMPSYADLALLHRACFPGYAYQLFVPAGDHVNLSRFTLHLWGRADGVAVTPRFHGGGPA